MSETSEHVRTTRTINRALTRPETVAGAEKGPLGVVVTAAVLFGFCAWLYLSVAALLACLILLLYGVPLLRRIAKADPQMFSVFRANMLFLVFYSGKADAGRRGDR